MPISQVRLHEACAAYCPATTSAAWAAVAEAVGSGCSSPRSPANAQQPQLSGTSARSATARPSAIRASLLPKCAVEHVGWRARDASLRGWGRRGSSVSTANWTLSVNRSGA
ncbi:hypothetical protein ACIRD6_33295 [Streptomyces sp. NPDC102473]|uniref:hypothetical protein n=1 Tax=Streptomyces sp. NPDC102473 TaxID=3366180 RepID=UPI0037FEE9AC